MEAFSSTYRNINLRNPEIREQCSTIKDSFCAHGNSRFLVKQIYSLRCMLVVNLVSSTIKTQTPTGEHSKERTQKGRLQGI
jgi:hypothetical protein